MDNFGFFDPNLPKNRFRLEIQKTNVEIRISILEILCVLFFFGKTDKFYFFCQNLPKNGFWGKNFKNLNRNSESTPPRYHVCQFSGKTNNFEFFGLNLRKLPNYVQYFGSKNVAGVAESWVETETSWVELDRAG